MTAARPKARSDLTIVELDGEAVIYDDGSGEVHHLNETATLAFSLLDGTTTVAEIAQDLGEAYGIPAQAIGRELEEVVARFGQAGLLDSEAASRGPNDR